MTYIPKQPLELPLLHAEITQMLEEIGEAESIVITAHQNPDGDAVGSALALYHILRFAGKNCVCVLPDRAPDFLSWMPGFDTLLYFDAHKEEATALLKNANVIFCLDYNSPERLGREMGEVMRHTAGYKIMIDHHPQPEMFCQATINYPADCSTCQLIYRFVCTIGYENHVGSEAADCLYTGIMTDTGSFRYPATTALTHFIVAKLIEAGANNVKVHNSVFDANTESRLRLMGYALSEKLVILPQFHTAYISLTEAELQKFNYQKGDTEGLVNYGLSMAGIQFAAIFMEKDGQVKLSFRSKGDVPVNTFMQQNFSGGGHKNAAGGRSNATMDVTIQKFLSLIPGFMKAHVHE